MGSEMCIRDRDGGGCFNDGGGFFNVSVDCGCFNDDMVAGNMGEVSFFGGVSGNSSKLMDCSSFLYERFIISSNSVIFVKVFFKLKCDFKMGRSSFNVIIFVLCFGFTALKKS